MLGLSFSSKLDWGSYIISIAKTASKKIKALILSMKFLPPEVAMYLYKCTIRPCMECFVMSGLVLLAASSKCCRNAYEGQLIIHLLSLLNPWLFATSLNLFWSITFVYLYMNCFRWFHFLTFKGSLLVILIDCMIFLPPFLDVIRMSVSTVSFLTQLDSAILCL